MSAIRLARAATGRKIIVKFEGCYHGHADGLLVKAGSGVATFGIPGSAGVPEEIAHLTLALPYNDLAAVEAAFAAHPGAIAAVILEPVVGNAGCIRLPPAIWPACARSPQREGALLIVDEVMTGFRVALGGALRALRHRPRSGHAGQDRRRRPARGRLRRQARASWTCWRRSARSIRPEPSAAIRWPWPPASPRSAICRSTPLEVYPQLEATAKAVAEGVAAEAARAGVPLTLNRVGSMWTWFFTASPVTNYAQAAASDTAAFGRFHRAMLDRGVWLPPSQFEAAFLSTAHGDRRDCRNDRCRSRGFQSCPCRIGQAFRTLSGLWLAPRPAAIVRRLSSESS